MKILKSILDSFEDTYKCAFYIENKEHLNVEVQKKKNVQMYHDIIVLFYWEIFFSFIFIYFFSSYYLTHSNLCILMFKSNIDFIYQPLLGFQLLCMPVYSVMYPQLSKDYILEQPGITLKCSGSENSLDFIKYQIHWGRDSKNISK